MKSFLPSALFFFAISLSMNTTWSTASKETPTYTTPWIPETEYQTPLFNIMGLNWMERHQSYVDNTRVNGSKINVLFLGDSLTDFYRDQGRAVWEQVWEPLGAVNYGIAGDRTEHLLWRITNGEITGLHPKVVVMMIGVNNIWCNKTEPEIARGVSTIVGHLRKSLPTSKILLLGNTPGHLLTATPPVYATPVAHKINQITSKLDDGNHLRFLDVTDLFYNKATQKQRDERYVGDRLHFNEEGYISLYEKMWPLVRELLGNDGKVLPEKPKSISRLNPVDNTSGLTAAVKTLPGGRIDWVQMCTSYKTH